MRFQLNAPEVVQETIDGEVMIVHLVTGVYYNLSGLSAHLWRCIISGASLVEICEHYTKHFPDFKQSIPSSIETFNESLKADDLIRECQSVPKQQAITDSLSSQFPVSWDTPRLCRHTDMQDLLLVDPIHEVESSGWPQKDPGDPSSET